MTSCVSRPTLFAACLCAASLIRSARDADAQGIMVRVSASSSTAGRTEPKSFTGRLNTSLVGTSLSPVTLRVSNAPELLSRLPKPLAPGEQAFFGSITRQDFHTAPPTILLSIPIVLVESATEHTVYINQRADTSAFRLTDRASFSEPSATPQIPQYPGDLETAFTRPMPSHAFVKAYSYRLVWSPARTQNVLPAAYRTTRRALWLTGYVAQGTVDVHGRPVLVQYDVDELTGTLHSGGPGWYAMDVDGDGAIDSKSLTEHVWYDSTSHGPLIFHVGDFYLSPGPADNASGAFTVVERTVADYQAFDLKVGTPVPDFTFTDMSGTRHNFSDFRGRYILLDFWQLGCGPCRAEMPQLKRTYDTYAARGFEIVSFDKEDDAKVLPDVVAFLHEHAGAWTQVSTASPRGGDEANDLVMRRFHVGGFPTTLLIDPKGVIVSTDGANEPGLRGDALAKTLETLLPAATH